MPITLEDVAELEAELEMDRQKIEVKEEALRVLKTMITDTAKKSTEKIILSGLSPPDPTKRSLEKRVYDIVCLLDDQEFEVSQIEEQLKIRGESPKSKTPRASIAMALQKLEQKGDVVRTYKGIGSEPHRFKKQQATPDADFY